MAIFVTGATGYIGRVVCERLRERGHTVTALARSPEATAKLTAAGITPIPGSLADLDALTRASREAEAVIHLAFPGTGDSAPVTAMLDALAGSNKPFIYTSGVWVMGNTGDRLAGEMFPLKPPALVAWRPAVERLTQDATERKVRGIVLRVARVYGRAGGPIAACLERKTPWIGDGSNRWSFVHVDDLADLYLLALQRAPAGSLYLAAHGPAIRVSELMAAAGHTELMPLADARAKIGPLADAIALDQKIGSTKAARELGWRPKRPSVLDEIKQGYFAV